MVGTFLQFCIFILVVAVIYAEVTCKCYSTGWSKFQTRKSGETATGGVSGENY